MGLGCVGNLHTPFLVMGHADQRAGRYQGGYFEFVAVAWIWVDAEAVDCPRVHLC